jgi:hypothetical protein
MNNYTFNSNQKQPVYLSNGKVIGCHDGETFYKTIQASKHILIYPPSLASDVDVLQKLTSEKVTYFHAKEIEKNVLYIAKVQEFWKYGISINRGYGKQIALPIKYWKKVEMDKPKQYGIWGV